MYSGYRTAVWGGIYCIYNILVYIIYCYLRKLNILSPLSLSQGKFKIVLFCCWIFYFLFSLYTDRKDKICKTIFYNTFLKLFRPKNSPKT